MIDLIILIIGIICVFAWLGLSLANRKILRIRKIWTEDNEPSVKMSFSMFHYIYTMAPSEFYLRDYSVHIDILSHEEPVSDNLDKIHTLQYREFCPIIFNQIDTLRYILWRKYKRPKELQNLQRSIKYAKVFSSLIPQFVTLSEFRTDME